MKSESGLMSVIEKYPYAASFKEADTGKYILANDRLALDIGIQNPKDLIGLTVHDLQFAQSKQGTQQAQRIAKFDFFACEKKEPAQSQFVFCKSDSGDVLYDEVIKLPVLGQSGNILGVVTYQRNLTSTLPNPPKLRHFSNFSDSWPCAVFDLGYVVLSDFHDGGTSDRQSSRAFPAAVCQPFCRSLRPAEEWASTV